jgi:hypothetical protein
VDTSTLTRGGVRQIELPADARALGTLQRVDYEDAFLVEGGAARDGTPEQWARAMFEGAPLTTRAAMWSTWVAIGLRLGSPLSRRSVLGLEVRRSDPDFVLLGAGSWIGMPAELLLQRRRDGLLFSTMVQQSNRIARAVWARVEPRHVPVVRSALARVARRADATDRRA